MKPIKLLLEKFATIMRMALMEGSHSTRIDVSFDTYKKIISIMEDPYKVMRIFMSCKSSQAYRT